MAMFLDRKCRHCEHYRYLNSDFGGHYSTDFYTCIKNVFKSTEENGWYIKAQKCKIFVTPPSLSEEELKAIKRFEQNKQDKETETDFSSFSGLFR
jgi:hypothetical protein